MRKITSIVLLAMLGTVMTSCSKETMVEDTCIISTTSSATYYINGQQYYAEPRTESEWSAFLDYMLALAREGYTVRFERMNSQQQIEVAKEKVTYTTKDFNKAKAWSMQMALQGYSVTISYNQETGEYTCIAVR